MGRQISLSSKDLGSQSQDFVLLCKGKKKRGWGCLYSRSALAFGGNHEWWNWLVSQLAGEMMNRIKSEWGLKEDSMKSSVGRIITFRCRGCEKTISGGRWVEKNRKMALSHMQYDGKYRGRAQCWYRRAFRFIEFITRKIGGAGKNSVWRSAKRKGGLY